MSQSETFGLAALGVSDGFTVEVLSTQDQNRWLLCIEFGNWSLDFEILERNSLAQLLKFLRANVGQTVFAELPIGIVLGSHVLIVKDDEFPDRFFLKAHIGGFRFRVTVIDPVTTSFLIAVEQAVEEFASS